MTWKILGLITVTIIIIIIEYPGLKKMPSKNMWSFACLLSIGVLLSLLEFAEIKIFNPMDAIKYVYKPLYDNLFNWLS